MHGTQCEAAAMPFADDVRAGLTAVPKTLPPRYFYDELGSALFDAICLLPEYYLMRAEDEIFAQHATDIVAAVSPARLIELGSGSARKTRRIIDAAFQVKDRLRYDAIDISPEILAATARALESEYIGLTVGSYQGEYYDGLRKLEQATSNAHTDGPTLALFLGSNIGNFDPPEALRFLQAIRGVLRESDALLLGTDLKKDPKILEAAYDDAIGLTAAFNRNLLARINRELSGTFDVHTFAHRALYDQSAGRIEMHLVSTQAQHVAIKALSLNVSFTAGETIHTESSYKFSRDDIQQLALASGFQLEASWTDSEQRFACNLLRSNRQAKRRR